MLLRRKIAIPIRQRLELLRTIRALNKQVYSASYTDYTLFHSLPDTIFEDAVAHLNTSMQQALPKLRVNQGSITPARTALLNAMLADIQSMQEQHWNPQQALHHANSRAAFRVTQTLNNLQASHKAETYTSNNILFFQWQTKEDNHVRPRHAHLDGMVFAYANPPIANLTTGERFLPGQDWGCRCIDIPILGDNV